MLLKTEDDLGIITFNRPAQHNAFNEYFIHKLTRFLTYLNEEPKIKIVMLTGNGENFSAGADLEWMKKMAHYTQEENLADAMQLVYLLKTLFNLQKPTIALAKGKTLAGGVGLLSCCDIVIAEEKALFAFTEAKIGLIPATISPYVINAIGAHKAKYYFLTAQPFNAYEAQQIGLVHSVVKEDNLYNEGLKIANRLTKNGPQALTAIKKLVTRFVQNDDSLLLETAELIAKIRISEEAQTGLTAFFEKRQPIWK